MRDGAGRFFLAIFLLGFALFCVACDPFASDENINIGMEALAAQEYDAALTAFAVATAAGEDGRLIQRGIAIAQMGRMQYREALDTFKKALSYGGGVPDRIDFDINYYMASAFYLLGEKDAAIDTYDAILALRANEGDAYYLRGAIYVEQGRIEEALADFDRSLAIHGSGDGRLIDIYQILAEGGYRQTGEEYLWQALDEDMRRLENFERGRIYFFLGDYENARMHLERARGTSYEAVLYLGKTYEVLGDFNYAVSVYSTYLDDGNPSPHIYNQLGVCRLKMNDYEGALAAFLGGMAVEDNDILQTLRFNEIVTYEFLGDFTKAAVLMDAYVREYPGDQIAERENYFLRSR